MTDSVAYFIIVLGLCFFIACLLYICIKLCLYCTNNCIEQNTTERLVTYIPLESPANG